MINWLSNILSNRNSLVKKVAEVIVLILAAVFIGRFLWSGWPQLVNHIKYAKVGLILLGLVLFFIYFALRSIAWKVIMGTLGADLSIKKSGYIWFVSEFSRYIPGNVWSFLGRVYLSNKEKIPKRVTSLSLIFEIFYLVGSSLGLGVVFFLVGPPDVIRLPWWIILIVIPIIVTIINPKILGRLVNKVLRILKKDELNVKLGFGHSIGIYFLYTLSWLSYGLASYFVAAAFVDIRHVSVVWLICAFVLSWAIGYLSFVTPMGLGVREAILVTILKTVISGPLASLVALVTRVALIISELISLSIIMLIKKYSGECHPIVKLETYWRGNKHQAILILMIVMYIGYFAVLTFLRHSNYLSSRFDLGNMDQTVWNTAFGNFFQLTSPDTGLQVSRFSIHGDIFLALLAPFYRIYASPYVLLFVQTVIVAFGALPLYWLAKDILKSKGLALALAFAYLMNPGTQWATIFDFHSVTLATAFLVYTFYFAYKKKYWLFAIFALLSLMTKETIAFSIVLISLYIIISQKNYKAGVLVGTLAIVWFGLLLGKIMPEARDGTSSHFALGYYKSFGATPVEIIKNVLSHPSLVFDYIQENGRWNYLGWVLAPAGFLGLLSPFILLAVPAIAINVLSDQSQMTRMYYHYTSDIAPFVFISTVFGLSLLIRTLLRYIKVNGKQLDISFYQKKAIIYLVAVTLIGSWLWSPLPLARNADIKAFTDRNPAKNYLDELAATIPKSASVSATNRMSPHFTDRKISYYFPVGVNYADYIVIEKGYEFDIPEVETSKIIENLEDSSKHDKIYDENNIVVFKMK
ncbi:MAG: DUF2079 domain-containing protein [bacterium]|nr:DUF2079 domain-containing protein [bacterium]